MAMHSAPWHESRILPLDLYVRLPVSSLLLLMLKYCGLFLGLGSGAGVTWCLSKRRPGIVLSRAPFFPAVHPSASPSSFSSTQQQQKANVREEVSLVLGAAAESDSRSVRKGKESKTETKASKSESTVNQAIEHMETRE